MTSPVLDFKAIVTALGARFTAAAMGTPTGADAIRKVYPQSAKGLLALPAVVLEVQDGDLRLDSGWKHEMNIDLLLCLSLRTADLVRLETQRQLYLPYLLHATVDQSKLGLGGATGYSVDKAIPIGWEWDTYKVADQEYEAIRVHYRVYVTEIASLTP